MKRRKNKLFLKFIDRVMIAVLTLSLLVMPAESAVAAPEEEPKEPEAVALDDTPSPSDTETESGSIADSDIAVTNEIIVVYDDAGVSEAKSEEVQEQAEEALDDIDAEITDEVAESNDQQGTVVVAEIPKEADVEEAIEQIEADENVSFAQPNFVYSALGGDIQPIEDLPEEEETLDLDGEEAADAKADTDSEDAETGDMHPGSAESDNTEPGSMGPEVSESEKPEVKEEEESPDTEPERSEAEDTEPAADMEILDTGALDEDMETDGIEEKAITNDTIYNMYLKSNYLNATKTFEAWDSVKSQKRVTVAVLDSGCRLDHEDLQNNILKGYAYDSYYDRPLTVSSAPNGGDPTGHGTHVCGLIAAEANNGRGIAGTSYNANILPIKIFDNYGGGATTATFLKGLEYCRQLIESGKVTNLRVINMSIGYYSDGRKESVDVLLENKIGVLADYYNVLCVCAGGNGDNIRTPYVEPMYPSDFEDCLSVTALDDDNYNCQWSDYNQSKDISAPGEEIVSTYNGARNSYAYMNGTSMAAPIVSGICALLWAKNPSLQVDEVVEAVEVTADSNSVQYRAGDVTDTARKANTGSHGAINAAKALSYVSGKITETGSRNIGNAQISGISASYEYTGGRISPNPVVTMSGITLKKNSDYRVSYGNNVNVGTATVTIEGIGRFAGTVVKTFTIGRKNIAKCSVTLSGTSYVYTGGAIKPAVTVQVSGQNTVKLKNGVDYTIAYSNNIKPGTATVTIKAKGNNYTGSIVKKFKITKKSISKLKVSLSAKTYTYNKKAKKPSVAVKNGKTKLKKGRDYKVAYSNNVKVGTATVKIAGIGNYNGTIKKTFTINPKGTSISKLTKKKKGFKVKWKKQATWTTGYQIQYSTNKNFKSAKTKTIKKTKTTSTTISKLKKKKVYYVRIRTYRKVGKKNYFSSWSKVKKVKTK